MQFETKKVRILHIEHFLGHPGLGADTWMVVTQERCIILPYMNNQTKKTNKQKTLHLLNILTEVTYAGSHQRTCFVYSLLHILHIAGLFRIRFIAYKARKEVEKYKNENCL